MFQGTVHFYTLCLFCEKELEVCDRPPGAGASGTFPALSASLDGAREKRLAVAPTGPMLLGSGMA